MSRSGPIRFGGFITTGTCPGHDGSLDVDYLQHIGAIADNCHVIHGEVVPMNAVMSIGQASPQGVAIGSLGGHPPSIVGKVPSSGDSGFTDTMVAIQDTMRGMGTAGGPDPAVTGTADSAAVSGIRPGRLSATLADMVDSLGRSEATIDRLIRRGMRGRSLSQEELLGMQALVYRYSQKLEVASRLTESVTNSVKQILNIQV